VRQLFFIFMVFTLLSPSHSSLQVIAPVKPASVRMAVIGDMGTGETRQYDESRRMMEARATFPFDFTIMLGEEKDSGASSRFETFWYPDGVTDSASVRERM
jgi:hypothetical protein